MTVVAACDSQPSNLKKNNNTVSKTLIYGAHEAIPCAPELSVFGTVGANEACSCASGVPNYF